MAATCTTCETAAGPTIRVSVDTVMGTNVALSLTVQQALDLYAQLGREFSRNRIPHIDIPE